uniref:Uncharacterized protein n=1 Tax=Anopheles atroparvus TaxID=41427 RepID=A0A182IWT7_ANOAO
MAAMALKMTCNNPKNLFCFVCGVYTKSHHKRSIMTKPLIDAYEAYFVEARTAKRNYVHGPPSVCNDCNNALLRWANGLVRRPELPFDVPMIWSEPRNHQTDCYFCLTHPVVPGRQPGGYFDQPFEYPNNLHSAIKPRLMGKKAPGMENGPVCTVNRRGRSMGPIMNAPTASMQPPRILTRVDRKSVTHAPAQPNDSRVRLLRQTGPVLVAGMKRKSSLDPPSANTYDVTKVRLRSSEPSIVLEQSEKRLPSTSVSATSPPAPVRTFQPAKPTATSVPMQPTITRVFSLQGEIPAYDDFSSSPTELLRAINGHMEMPITIEIDDDDDDDEEEEVKVKQQMKDEEDETIPDQEQQSDEQEPETYQQQQEPAQDLQEEVTLEEENEQEEQRQFPQPVEEDRKPPMAAAAQFINIHSLPSASSTASSKMVVVKMTSPQKPNVAPSTTSSGVTVRPTTATTTTPNVTRLFPVGTGRAPHLITQSELILLLRDLELTRDKSAILIDRLKRWNLLAAQLVKPTRPRNSISGPAPEQPKPPALPVVRRVSTLAALSTMGSVTIKQGARTPVVLTTPTGVQRNGRQSFIRLAPAAVQSNTVTTSNNSGKVTVTANGVPVLRQQLQTIGGRRSPVKLKVISESKLVTHPVEQLQPITTNNN